MIENNLQDTVLENILDIDMAVLGVFSKEKLGIDDILDTAESLEEDITKQAEFAVNIIKKWQNIMQTHSQYIINYFMSKVFAETNNTDSPFWDNYLIDGSEYNDEECLQIFQTVYTDEFVKELDKYLVKDNTPDIKYLVAQKFKFFDYDKFIKSIKLEYINLDIDSFSIQMSDKYNSCLCSAYEQFDEDMNGQDWHNF